MSRRIEARHEVDLRRQLVDIRPASEQMAEWLSKPLHLAIATTPAALLAMAFPLLALPCFLAIAICVFAHLVTHPMLPFRYPKGEVNPQTRKEGDGILFFGNVDSDSPYEAFKEIWLADDDLRKHIVILGSTGSGKSETLKAIFFNALAWSSGFFIADGKADNKLPVDVYSMVRANGRDQDLLILNFLMAGKTPEQIRLSRRRRSNSLNPFSSADPDTIIQMGTNLLPKVEGEGKNWQEKALNLWRALVTALCYLRDERGRELSITDFLDYLALNKVEELYLLGYDEAMENGGEWSYGFVGIKTYLESGGCPGYMVQKLLSKHGRIDSGDSDMRRGGAFNKPAASKGNEQDPHAHEQHAYRTTQLMPALNLLDKSYGYIFKRKFPEIDMVDVTLRNRILVMLIPSLEKSAQEAENLGKLTIACLRVMMSKNLGSEVEGSYQRLILDKATESPYPYVAALDELAYYFADGIAVMFAQARSLGICMIAAAQDLEKLTEGSRSAEAGAMIANTANKYFMRNDDQNKTPEMVQKIVGKAKVAVKRSYERGVVGYKREDEIDIVEEDRVTLKQMQAFKAGQGIFNQGGVSRFMKSFYMGQDLEKHRPTGFHINRFLQVATPSRDDVIARSIALDSLDDPYEKGRELVRKLRREEAVEWAIPANPVVEAVVRAVAKLKDENPHIPPHEKAINLYLAARSAVLAARIPVPEPATAAQQADTTQDHVQDALEVAQHGADLVPGDAAEVKSLEAMIADLDGYEDTAQKNSQTTSVQSSVAAPGGAVQAQEEKVDADDILSFLNPVMPFARKPAQEILSEEVQAPAVAQEQVDASVSAAVAAAVMDPMEVLMAGGRTLNLGPAGGGLRSILKPKGGGVLKEKGPGVEDSWIQDGIQDAAKMLETPRSSDNTVVGLTKPTMEKIAEAEAVLGNTDPARAARDLERVVSARVTPTTQAKEDMSEDDLDTFFATLQNTLKP